MARNGSAGQGPSVLTFFLEEAALSHTVQIKAEAKTTPSSEPVTARRSLGHLEPGACAFPRELHFRTLDSSRERPGKGPASAAPQGRYCHQEPPEPMPWGTWPQHNTTCPAPK